MEEAKKMVLARLHLRAVLPLLEDIATYDREIQDLTKNWNGVIQLQLPGGDPATALVFNDGKLSVFRGNYPGRKVTLTFKNADMLNEVFQGKSNKNPIPNLRAVFHLAKLLKIDKVLKRLEYYMKPDEKLFSNQDFFNQCIKLQIYALTFGIKEVGEHDPELTVNTPYLPNGTLAINVLDGPSANITLMNGKLYPLKGKARRPNAILEIRNTDIAWKMIQGELDVFAATGTGDIKLKGFIPIIDSINPLMDRLSYYLMD